MKALCITLDPHDPLRAQRAVREIKKLGLQLDLVSGVDGKRLTTQELKEVLTPRAYYEMKNGRYVHEALSSPGAVGCYLAHVRAWRIVAKAKEPFVIFEDDFVGKKNALELFHRGLKDLSRVPFDICRLQHRPNPDTGEILSPIAGTSLARVKRTEGCTAYIIRPQCAQQLLSTAFPIDCQVDHYVDFACLYHRLSNISLQDSIYDDPKLPSTIQHNTLQDPRCRREGTCILY